MAITPYLAMTAAEIGTFSCLPEKIGWMACHFSPYGTGLSNLPKALPEGALLILNDRTPMRFHDPEIIAAQLREQVERFGCMGVLLDFQQPDGSETAPLANFLASALPCPVGVSNACASGLDCPVFLPPVPADVPVQEYLQPWLGREIWLDIAKDAALVTVDKDGYRCTPLPPWTQTAGGHREEALHCHYTMDIADEQVRFTLFRTDEDIAGLLDEAEQLGVKLAVGLWQELRGQPDV